jgi:lipoprotein
MKRFTLLVTVAMTLLSSCGKEANEPIPSKQGQKSQESSFEFTMEGENETYLEGEAKALPFYPKAHVENGKITNISIETTSEPQKVKGIAYFYDPVNGKGIAKVLDFKIEGRRISYDGSIGNPDRIGSGSQMIGTGYTRVSFFIGGSFKVLGDTDSKGTKFEYSVGVQSIKGKGNQNLTLQRTTSALDLRKFNPIFVSEDNELQISPSKEEGGLNGVTTKRCKFRLFGEFINLRFRSRAVGKDFRFNGITIGGFASTGLHLEKPKNGQNKSSAPKFVPKTSSSTTLDNGGLGGIFYPFTDHPVAYEMSAPTSASDPSKLPGDPCYTLYLLSEAEPEGGIRFGFIRSNHSIFRDFHYTQKHNVTNLMGKKADSKNFGKFRNLTLELK